MEMPMRAAPEEYPFPMLSLPAAIGQKVVTATSACQFFLCFFPLGYRRGYLCRCVRLQRRICGPCRSIGYGFWYVMRVRSRKARLVEDHSCGAVTPAVTADLRRRLPVNSE